MMNRTKILSRLLLFADQALVSMGNFVVTLVLVRNFPSADFAGYGIGLAVALTISGAYRTSFSIPNALLSELQFKRRARALAAEHFVIVASISILLSGLAGISILMEMTEYQHTIVLGIFGTVPLYLSLDNDRVIGMRLYGPILPATMALSFLCFSATVALGVWLHILSFASVMMLLGSFGILKSGTIWFIAGRADSRHAYLLFHNRLKNTVGWVTVGTFASAGYSHIPMWILGLIQPPIQVAAYAAMRTPLQPLQIVIRSFDLFDKIAFSKLRPDQTQSRSTYAWRSYLSYLLLSMCFAGSIFLAGPTLIVHLLGPTYVPFSSTLSVWSLVFILVTSSLPLETVVYEARLYRGYALSQVAGAIFACLLAVPLSLQFQSAGAAGACFIGWCIPYCWLLVTFRLELAGANVKIKI